MFSQYLLNEYSVKPTNQNSRCKDSEIRETYHDLFLGQKGLGVWVLTTVTAAFI